MWCAALPSDACNAASVQGPPAPCAWLHACCQRIRSEPRHCHAGRAAFACACAAVTCALRVQEADVLTRRRTAGCRRCAAGSAALARIAFRVWSWPVKPSVVLPWDDMQGNLLPLSRFLLGVFMHAHCCELLCKSAGVNIQAAQGRTSRAPCAVHRTPRRCASAGFRSAHRRDVRRTAQGALPVLPSAAADAHRRGMQRTA